MTFSAVRIVTLAILFAGSSSVCLAQRAEVLGISPRSSAALTNHLTVALGAHRTVSDGQSSLGTWVVVGALVGAVAGGIWAGIEISKSDDPMMANAAFAVVTGAGAVVGGLVGALAYLGSHSQSQGQ